MTGLRLRPIALVALLGLVTLVSAPAMAFDLRESMIPSLEDAQNIMQYGSIVHDPVSRYIKPVSRDAELNPVNDTFWTPPDNMQLFEQPPVVPANERDTSAFSGETPRLGGGVPLASSGGGASSVQPVDRNSMRDTLQDVNGALGLK
jgi:hypothetical protein